MFQTFQRFIEVKNRQNNDTRPYRAIAGRLLVKRRERKLSQKELAALTNINASTISRYENCKFKPSEENLIKLAGALGTTIKYLKTGTE